MSFLVAFAVALFLIFLSRKKNFGHDYISGDQKFHINPTPRTGGIAILLGFMISIFFGKHEVINSFLIPSIILMTASVYEDVYSSVKPIYRLFFIFLSVISLVLINSLEIKSFGVSFLDYYLSTPIPNFIFTILTLSMLINAFNIIDGFNGLLSGFSIIILASIAYLSFSLGEALVYDLSVTLLLAVIGFFILNFPYGKIFLGDSGAYFLGMIIGFLLITISRNPEVSTWFALAVVIYPVYEIFFSIVRKKLFFNSPATQPDSFHLHMLVHKNLINCKLFNNKIFCNSFTSIIIWILSLFSIIPSLLWYDNSLVLFIVCLIFMVIYTVLYLKLLAMERK